MGDDVPMTTAAPEKKKEEEEENRESEMEEMMKNAVPIQRSLDLCLVLETPRGRGVFASCFISSGTILDTCPILLLQPGESIPGRTIWDYSYNWPTPNSPTPTQAIILGLGSMFNHSSSRQNVGWRRNVENQVVVYTALRDVRRGEELLISYGSRLTFRDVEEDERRKEESKEEEGDGGLGGLDVEGLF
ncbi:hypothetical protein EX30DRAFT_396384 [Ascodesmis nigricans]|uniref:SET domain-containing protein n=1 Tax=Ascodesmis nigricans TaxID=341454 RepID=A0A4S2MUW2_9PEZI|nr:hypothetical protein EX30DRAFT_396384 [Ascodesmis nigricans]